MAAKRKKRQANGTLVRTGPKTTIGRIPKGEPALVVGFATGISHGEVVFATTTPSRGPKPGGIKVLRRKTGGFGYLPTSLEVEPICMKSLIDSLKG